MAEAKCQMPAGHRVAGPSLEWLDHAGTGTQVT
jgi:hypothetical protein